MIAWLAWIPLALPPAVQAPPQSDGQQGETPAAAQASESPADRFGGLVAEYDGAMDEFWKRYDQVPEDEREAFYQEQRPDAEAFCERFLGLAGEFPGTDTAASALAWVVEHTEDADKLEVAVGTLLQDHPASPELARACGLLEHHYVGGAGHLRRILETSPDHAVQGKACYSLAKNCLARASYARRLAVETSEDERTSWRSYLGDAYESILASDPDALEKEAEEGLERVVVEYPDVDHWRGNLRKAAEGDLFQMHNLVIGKLAPEIAGEDIEGVPFKLSDYLGKVVVLDFWGHW